MKSLNFKVFLNSFRKLCVINISNEVDKDIISNVKIQIAEREAQAKASLLLNDGLKNELSLLKTDLEILKKQNEALKNENIDLSLKVTSIGSNSGLDFEIMSLKKFSKSCVYGLFD